MHDDKEPDWAVKNTPIPYDLRVGDYVFASRWDDCDPGDPWCVGYVEELTAAWVRLKGSNRRYPNAMRISVEQGNRIIASYPELECSPALPYREIYRAFNNEDPPAGAVHEDHALDDAMVIRSGLVLGHNIRRNLVGHGSYDGYMLDCEGARPIHIKTAGELRVAVKLARAHEALYKIRSAGNNLSDWATWAQKWAAAGQRPDFFKPPEGEAPP